MRRRWNRLHSIERGATPLRVYLPKDRRARSLFKLLETYGLLEREWVLSREKHLALYVFRVPLKLDKRVVDRLVKE